MSKVCSGGTKDKSIVCPFYKWQDLYRIACEGICKGSTVNLVFGNPKEKTEYKLKHCRNIECYKSCRVAQMLFGKYVDEE